MIGQASAFSGHKAAVHRPNRELLQIYSGNLVGKANWEGLAAHEPWRKKKKTPKKNSTGVADGRRQCANTSWRTHTARAVPIDRVSEQHSRVILGVDWIGPVDNVVAAQWSQRLVLPTEGRHRGGRGANL